MVYSLFPLALSLHPSSVFSSLSFYLVSSPPLASSQGNGKLRVLYEGFPMAMIIEQAGGSAR